MLCAPGCRTLCIKTQRVIWDCYRTFLTFASLATLRELPFWFHSNVHLSNQSHCKIETKRVTSKLCLAHVQCDMRIRAQYGFNVLSRSGSLSPPISISSHVATVTRLCGAPRAKVLNGTCSRNDQSLSYARGRRSSEGQLDEAAWMKIRGASARRCELARSMLETTRRIDRIHIGI